MFPSGGMKFAGPLAQGVSDNGKLFPLPSSLLHILFSTFHHSHSLPSIIWMLEVGGWKLEVASWKLKLVFVVLERACACLRRGQGGPWAPGAPPPGAIPAQTTTLNSCHAPLGFASKPMLILMSFVDRVGLDLGSLLGTLLVPFGIFFEQSWCPSRLQNTFYAKK